MKDLDRWVLKYKQGIESTHSIPSIIQVQDKATNLTFIIQDDIMVSEDNECVLPIDKVIVYEFKTEIYFKDKDRRIQEVLNSFD